ncbi:MAG: sigma-54-dependent Fis family transcriptional regulator [Bacteroidetes bacterium]|nr:MAG: sigma-54-dependent Fis family transcriptional regulator [Bacteroidota bacterium]
MINFAKPNNYIHVQRLMEVSQNILVLDDEKGFREEIGEFLKEEGYHVHTAGLPSEALQIIRNNDIDIAVFDIRMPEMDGLTFLNQIKQEYREIEIIMMTGYGDMGSVITAMRYGAVDFLKKPFKLTEIKGTINRVSKYRSIKSKINKEGSPNNGIIDDKLHMVGDGPAFTRILDLVTKVSKSGDATVLLTGETGTGKEMMAKTIHLLSNRKDNKFVTVNCSTIPAELFENEFFGHKQGSYTDAKQDQKGLFEAADKGTLFLDEIGDMKYEMQAKLLRVIEDKKVSRLGDHDDKEVDVRIVAATNHNLKEMVENKQFRIDLFHRLNIFSVEIPPLRERKEDIPLLFNYFVKYFSEKYNQKIIKVENSVITKLMNYNFPGNIRELKNIVERAVIMCDGDILNESNFDLLEYLTFPSEIKIVENNEVLDLVSVEKDNIMKALSLTKNNKTQASKLLNISRQALDRKIKKFGLNITG